MGYYFTKEDTEFLKESMSAVDAAQIFCGSVIKGDNIICPSRYHDDKNHGSCKTRNGMIYCFACQRSFKTCVDVVKDYFNVSFHESLEIIADELGILEQYSPKDEKQKDKIHESKKRQVIRVLSDEQKCLIGLAPPNPKLNKAKCYIGWRGDNFETGEEKREGIGASHDELGYLAYEPVTITHSSFAISDPLGYRTMVLNKCLETLDTLFTMIREENSAMENAENDNAYRWHELVSSEITDRWLQVYELGKQYGLEEVMQLMKKKINIPFEKRTA